MQAELARGRRGMGNLNETEVQVTACQGSRDKREAKAHEGHKCKQSLPEVTEHWRSKQNRSASNSLPEGRRTNFPECIYEVMGELLSCRRSP